MNKKVRISGLIIIGFGFIALIMGVTFLAVGYSKQAFMIDAMQKEKISLAALGIKDASSDDIIDSAEKAQVAADTVRAHRHSIAPSYGDLMAGGKYDPTNSKHLLYAQALNIENYLYLAVLGFGVVSIALATGGFMIVTGIALGIIGFVLMKMAKG